MPDTAAAPKTANDFAAQGQNLLDQEAKGVSQLLGQPEKTVAPPKIPEPPSAPSAQAITDPKDLQHFFAMAFTMSLVGGSRMRNPGLATLNAMTGAMQGYKQGNEDRYKASVMEFKTKMSEWQALAKKRIEDYNAVLNDAKLGEAQKALRLRGLTALMHDAIGNANANARRLDKIAADNQKFQESMAKLDMMGKRLDATLTQGGDKLKATNDWRRVQETDKLANARSKELVPIDQQLLKIKQIRAALSEDSGFSSTEIPMMVAELIRGARATNLQMTGMRNFGSLGERFTGELNRFATGQYTQNQKAQIQSLLDKLENNVYKPAASALDDRFKSLAQQRGISWEELSGSTPSNALPGEPDLGGDQSPAQADPLGILGD